MRYQLAKRRAGTHSTKGRAEVSGGGKKPWKQKGTGRARQGSTRSPQWRGGGVVFGPVPRSHEFKINKQVRRAALRGALSQRVRDNALVVLDELTLPEAKTKQMVALLDRFEAGKTVVVVSGRNEAVERSARNIPGVVVVPVEGLNVYDILKHKSLILTRDAVQAVTARLEG